MIPWFEGVCCLALRASSGKCVRVCLAPSCGRRRRIRGIRGCVPIRRAFFGEQLVQPPEISLENRPLLVIYATQHRLKSQNMHPSHTKRLVLECACESKSFPSSVLRHPKKVPGEKRKKGKKKIGTIIRPKIVNFHLEILPFLWFTQNGTSPGPWMPRRVGFFWCAFLIYVGFGGHFGTLFLCI